MSNERKRRANGEESREKILDATVEIAAARGYEGTSISAVSKLSGLPASSIYWHFADKDALIAAVIDRSFEQWLAASAAVVAEELDRPEVADENPTQTSARAMAKSLLESPDFLRLGLMVLLERRPEESSARVRFLQARAQARGLLREGLRQTYPALSDGSLELLTTYSLAGADGLFIEHEASGDAADLVQLFDLHSVGVRAVARHVLAEEEA